MGCGCNKNKGVRNAGSRPIVTPRQSSTTRGQAAALSPIQLQSIQAQKNKAADKLGLTNQRKEVERKRRAAIAQRTFGK